MGDISDSVVYEGDIPEDFSVNYNYYKFKDNKFVLDEEKLQAVKQEQEDQELNLRYIPNPIDSLKVIGKTLLKTLEIQDDDVKLQISGLYEDWESGNYVIGDIRNAKGQTWECFQTHDNAIYPDINPNNSAWFTFWRPLHGTSIETARPFVPVQGAHDIYKVGEYMIWTDDCVYKCIMNTNYSPSDYAQAWELVG